MTNSLTDDQLLKLIVMCISKGIGDVRNFFYLTNNVTNNSVSLLRADFINTNLRDLLVKDNVMLALLPFKRSGWTGIILIDRENKRTFSISTEHTLQQVISKKRQSPHYLQSILHVQNGDVAALNKQLYLFDDMPECQFSDDVFQRDYESIMGGEIQFVDGYRHFVIVYSTSHFEVVSIRMLELDSNFQVATEHRLENMLVPNFEDLTYVEKNAPVIKDAHSLVSVKSSILARTEAQKKPEVVVVPRKKGEKCTI